jgi:LPS-assembly protein
MRYRSLLLLPCLLFLSIPTPSAAAEADLFTAGAMKITADTLSYDQKLDTYNASGKVRIDWKGTTMFADMVSLRHSDNLADADGNVLFVKGNDTLRGEHASLNMETDKGVVTNGRLFIKQGNFRLSGARLEKTGDEDYHVQDGSFTTCDGDVPSWKFSAADLNVTREEYATGRHAFFYIKDVPVLYFPYIAYPVMTERQSGFLLAVPGHSSKKGFYIKIPYYFVISPSQDATVYLDIQTSRGVGVGGNYRYLLPAGGSGDLNAYLIYDTQKDMMRGTFVGRHQQSFSPSLFFRADIDLTLDRNFYRDYGEVNGEYNKQYLENTAFLTKHWERFSLTTEMKYTENLYATNNKATLQQMPTISFSGIKQRVYDTPFYVSIDSGFTNFVRQNGLQGQRVSLFPSLSYYASPGGILDVSAWVGYYQRFYNTYGGDIATGYNDSGIPKVGASLSSTLSKVYDVGWGNLKKVNHVMIPEIAYTFTPEQNQDGLPFFDYTDRQVEQNMVFYSITNYLTGKYLIGDGPAKYRDLAYLRVSQGYEFSGTRRDVLTLVDDQRPFTDVRIEAKVNPVEHISFYSDSRFNTYRANFSTADIGADVSDSRGNSTGIAYRFAKDQLSYLEGKLTVSYVKPFIFRYSTRYSFDQHVFLESNYALEFRQQCWGVTFIYQERLGDRSFSFNFSLAGLGSLGKLKVF